jgi:hypothetical protein
VRHTTQLRSFGAGAGVEVGGVAFFSEGEMVTGGTCDMMERSRITDYGFDALPPLLPLARRLGEHWYVEEA